MTRVYGCGVDVWVVSVVETDVDDTYDIGEGREQRLRTSMVC